MPQQNTTETSQRLLDPEQAIIVNQLTAAFSSVFDDWCDTPGQNLGDTDLEDAQTEAVLKVLARIGLDLPTLASLNTQDAVVFPVKHVTHYKGGHYLMLGTGVHTETEESLALYCKTTDGSAKWYARPLLLFTGFVDKLDCRRFIPQQVKRLIDPWMDPPGSSS